MGRHLKTGLGTMPWVFKLRPHEDELLSSFLVRTAHAHGMTPHRFCRLFIPGVQIWTRDIDCTASQSTLDFIAAQSGLSGSAVQAMTLLPKLPGSNRPAEHCARLAWVNAIGIYHRTRTRFGLQYCPHCLAATPAFLRAWRLSYVVACEVHQCFLLDRCRSCKRPLSQHRRGFDLTRCHHCGAALSQLRTLPSQDVHVANALEVQHMFESWAGTHSVILGSVVVSREDFFAGSMIILKAVREKMRSNVGLRGSDIADHCNGEGLRLGAVTTRASLCRVLYEVLSDWPINFLHFAGASRMTQVGVRHHGAAPAWLQEVIRLMPERTRPRYEMSAQHIAKRVRYIEAFGGTQCRSVRAEFLITAAASRA